MFRCGFCELDITPFAQTHIHGMFEERLMLDFHAAPYAKAVVMENDGEKVAILCLDSLYVYPTSYHEIVERASKHTGIKPENIMVAATHSHQSGITEYYDKHNEEDLFYIRFVRYRAADAIIFANNRLEEANVRFAECDVHGIAFVRNFLMKDGSIISEPRGEERKEIAEYETTIDPAYGVMSFVNIKGEVMGMISNYACHATADRPEERGEDLGWVSADYPGELSRRMKEIYGQQFVSLFLNGPCGNVGPDDFKAPMPHRSPYIGRVLADHARTLVERGELCQDPVVRSAKAEFNVKRRAPSEEELTWAKGIIDGEIECTSSQKRNNAWWILDYYKYYQTLMSDEITVRVQTVRVGDMLIYCLPSELFNHYSKKLKAASPVTKHMVSELGNGSLQYCVPPHLRGTDMYEAQPNCNIYEAAAGDIFVEKALELADIVLAD